MATKAELIGRLEELISQEDVENASETVEAVKEAYEALVASALQQQEAAAAIAPTEEVVPVEEAEAGSEERIGPPPAPEPKSHEPVVQLPMESAPLQDEEDKRFKQLLDSFNQRVNDIRRKKAKEEADNLAAKKAIMEEMKAMIAGEENIGTAFQRFSELQEKWKTIGPVPQQAYRELQADFSHLRDEFFYHIKIYKELRDHDLRKNTALKQALISDLESLGQKDGVKELEQGVKEYQEKWHQIGPVVREEWESIRDQFWNATRTVYDKIHEHYRARRAEHETNLQAKQHLVEKVLAIGTPNVEAGAKEWKQLTEEVLEAQQAWKAIGFATKKDNERIWKEFRNACNAFFDAKKEYFDKLKDQFKDAREKKQALLQEALELKDSTEWRKSADKLKNLQQQWKEAGSAGPRDENKLWNKFREACDSFFKNRKQQFEQADAEQAVHAQEKEALLAEIDAYEMSGDRNKDVENLKAFSLRWMNSGRVSPKQYDAFSTRYRAALDKQYGKLKMEGDERRKMQFNNRVEDIKSSGDPKFALEKETRFIKRKIEELETERRQIENSMGMFNFKSASGEAMKKDMEGKIEKLNRDVERLKVQHKDLMKELRGVSAQP
ncbi:MAG: DUF349 domain-containing protein [Bacteroidota bacterium]|nr:DUF349 domain-containing protein [Bacteroidota bacterium]